SFITTQAQQIPAALQPANMLKDSVLATLEEICSSANAQDHNKKIMALVLMGHKQHKQAREILNDERSYQNLLAKVPAEIKKDIDQIFTLIAQNKITEVKEILSKLDVTPENKHQFKSGGYKTYYEDKGEQFSITDQKDWKDKQKNIYAILNPLKPETVLDVGSNSGWFSMLAAHLGAQVTATDIDEASLDSLYDTTKSNKLNILPLILPFQNMNEPSLIDHYKSDVVLCLALVHHLVFLCGLTLEQIFETLAKFTKKTLVIEYINLHDETFNKTLKNPAIIAKKEMFEKAIGILNGYAKEKYNEKYLIELGKKYFKSCTILNSNPKKTRTLLIFSK
ncbi:MAG: class I SAM-dependent methyltransferase, partial [bacterium]